MYAPFNKSLIEFVLNWTEYYYITSSDCNSYEVQCCRRDLYVKEKRSRHMTLTLENQSSAITVIPNHCIDVSLFPHLLMK